MPVLNRFPLLGLWAREAARRLGYPKSEADSLGHAYAVLYAIRHARPKKKKGEAEEAPKPPREPGEQVDFCGDRLDVVRDESGHLRGHVGGDGLQTPRSYEAGVEEKFPPGWYEKLEKAFREVLRRYPPRALREGRLLYRLYDGWKKRCAAGRSVDLGELLRWCRKHRPGSPL